MKLWRPEKGLQGPRTASSDDIDALNQLFSEAFTDRYRRDGLVGVRVPRLNPVIWRYALQDAGDGAMLWFDENDELVAFNIAHRSGVEGWMGPLAVRSDRQGLGVGRAIVETAVAWLRDRRVCTLGLETMPRTVENIGFYAGLGFMPEHLTMTMTRDAARRTVRGKFVCLSELDDSARAELSSACFDRLAHATGGYDFTGEIELTAALDIGDTVVVEGAAGVAGFALYHSVPLAENGPAEELRVLKLFADSTHTFDKLVHATERCAARLRIPRVAFRCQTGQRAAFQTLGALGYRVRWTDLRMTLDGLPAATLAPEEVLFSNWEI